MTGRTSRTRKYILFLLKLWTFWINGNFVKNILGKHLIFFLWFWHFWWQYAKFHTYKISFLLSISVSSKVITFFVKNLQKLNILSVIAFDWVKIFKYTKNHLAHFTKVLQHFWKKKTHWNCFRYLATFVLCGIHLGNYMQWKQFKWPWIYEIHQFQLKFVYIYRNEVKIIAITYFLATLAILDKKIAITHYLVIVSTWN